jgi:hypothetical protein
MARWMELQFPAQPVPLAVPTADKINHEPGG